MCILPSSLSQPFVSHSNYWNEEMNSFTNLPPLEMEPLPSLFPFSSCAAAASAASYASRPERPTHDVADVLLSLKNAVLKPNGESHSCHQTNSSNTTPQSSYGTSQPSNGALSYTVHHPQILLSPTPHHHYYQCHQNQSQAAYNSNNYYDSSCPAHQHYPSMSLNVSMNMNMTMHASYDGPCSQMQWNPPSNNPSSVNVLCPPPFSPAPPYPSATYSFSADFRSPSSDLVTNANNSGASHNTIAEEEEPMLDTVKMSPSPLPVIVDEKSFVNSSTYFSTKPLSTNMPPSPSNYEVKKFVLHNFCFKNKFGAGETNNSCIAAKKSRIDR